MSETKKLDIGVFFREAAKRGASDVLLTAGTPPCLRLHNEIQRFDLPPLTSEQSRRLIYSVLTQAQIAKFEEELELDFAVHVDGLGRFRGNAYQQRGAAAAVFRLVPAVIPTMAELKLPPILAELARLPQGLVLFTGPTGHGKSTAQAAMIDLINRERRCHIVTVEDPIEYLHRPCKAVVDQREVGCDTRAWSAALRHVLRQAPDVLLIGEMRDLETMAVSLTAAETGHLVLATLHTNSAVQSIDRIIDSFPPHQQNQIRTQLSLCLAAVVGLRLLPTADGAGLTPAVEVLRNTPAVGNLIREGKTEQLASILETHGKLGMKTMDAAVVELYRDGEINRETAVRHMLFPQNLPKVV